MFIDGLRRLLPITGLRKHSPPLAAALYDQLRAVESFIRAKLSKPREIKYMGRIMFVCPADLEGDHLVDIVNEENLPTPVRIWREVTRRQPKICIDVGSNYGLFTMAGHYSSKTVCYAFEPNPNVYEYLLKSVHSHPDRFHIKTKQVAVSDRTGETKFNVDIVKSGTSSLYSSPRFRAAIRRIRINTISLDDFLTQTRLNFGGLVLIKTDTEGADYRVLRGGLKFLTHARQLLGICEFAPDLLEAAGTPPVVFLDFLRRHFALWEITDRPVPRIISLSSVSLDVMGLKIRNILYSNDPKFVRSVASSLRVPFDSSCN